MKLTKNFEIINRLFCEDIRQEKSNKLILIGVFAGDIVMKELPGPIPVSIYAQVRSRLAGENALWIKMSGPGKDSFEIKCIFRSPEPDTVVNFATPKMDIQMECPGVFKIAMSADGKRWKTIIQKRVSASDDVWSLSSISSLPHSEQFPPAVPAS